MYELDREIFRDEAEISIDSSNRRFRAIFLLPSISLTVRTSCASRRRQGDAKFPPWKSTLPWQVRVGPYICMCVCVCALFVTVHDHRNLSERAFATNSTVCEHGTIENNCRKTFDSSYKRSSPEFCLLSIERFSFFFFFSPFPFPSSGINSVNSTKSYLIFAQSVSTKEEKLVSSRFF